MLDPRHAPQLPLPHVRVRFMEPKPHVVLQLPKLLHAVHETGVPAFIHQQLKQQCRRVCGPTEQLNDCVFDPAHLPQSPPPHVRV